MSEHGWETLRAVGVAQSTRIAPLHLDMNGVDGYSLFVPPDPLSALQSAGVPGSCPVRISSKRSPALCLLVVLANGKQQ